MSAKSTLKIIATETTPSSATTAASAGTIKGCNGFDSVCGILEFTGVGGGMGGTLDVYVQSSWDEGTTWFDFVHFTQFASGAASSTAKFSSDVLNTITTIGKNTSPALAANSCAGRDWGDWIRMLYVAGASTTAGATVKLTVIGKNTRASY